MKNGRQDRMGGGFFPLNIYEGFYYESFITIHYQSAIYTTMTDLKNFPSSFN